MKPHHTLIYLLYFGLTVALSSARSTFSMQYYQHATKNSHTFKPTKHKAEILHSELLFKY